MPMTPREMIKHLKKNGFEEIRQKWFSYHHEKPNYWEICSCSLSPKAMKKGLEQAILKQAGLR